MVVPCHVYYKAIQKDAVLISFYIDGIEKRNSNISQGKHRFNTILNTIFRDD